ncbi:MAG: RNA pyrophosphohydrolase [Alphaproteobacteria bacterium]
MHKDHTLPYRPGVGIVLINQGGFVWIGQRIDPSDDEHWQMPQGGIDGSEAPVTAAHRELLEETGTNKAEIIAETQGWHIYDLPKSSNSLKGRFRGQRQKWFAMRFTGDDSDFNIQNPPGGEKAEFRAWRWEKADEVKRLIVAFKRPVYEAVLSEFGPLLK